MTDYGDNSRVSAEEARQRGRAIETEAWLDRLCDALTKTLSDAEAEHKEALKRALHTDGKQDPDR